MEGKTPPIRARCLCSLSTRCGSCCSSIRKRTCIKTFQTTWIDSFSWETQKGAVSAAAASESQHALNFYKFFFTLKRYNGGGHFFHKSDKRGKAAVPLLISKFFCISEKHTSISSRYIYNIYIIIIFIIISWAFAGVFFANTCRLQLKEKEYQ